MITYLGDIEYVTSDPSSPVAGEIWYNITLGVFKYYDGVAISVKKFITDLSDFDTDDLDEGITNQYWTNARTISSTLTGYTSGAGTISSADTVLSAIQKLNGNIAALSYEVPLTFSTGLTRTTNTITANLSTGVSGGQTAIGGTGSGDKLNFSSTSNATKGKFFFDVTHAYTKPFFSIADMSTGSATTRQTWHFGNYSVNYSALWCLPLDTTPSNSNYILTSDATNVYLNGISGIQFSISDGGKMYLNSSGNLYIGANTSATAKLDIKGAGSTTGFGLRTLQSDGTTVASSITDAGNGYYKGYLLLGATSQTSTAAKLELTTGNNSYGWLHTNGTVTAASFIDVSNAAYFGTVSNHAFDIFTNAGVSRFRVGTAGNVALSNNLYIGNVTGIASARIEIKGLGSTTGYAIRAFQSDATTESFSVTDAGTGIFLGNLSAANLTSGTYTPTLFNTANLDASTAYLCTYQRVGNTVTVSGRVDVDPTTTLTDTQLGISLPIASNFSTANQCGGTAYSNNIAAQGAAILSDATNDRVLMQWKAADTTNQSMYFIFTYQII